MLCEPRTMITDKKLNKVNQALSDWMGATADLVSFKNSMSNSLCIALAKDGNSIAMNLGAVQYIQGNVYQTNVELFCEKIIFEGVDCFLLKDRNSDFKLVIGAAIHLGSDFIVAAND